MLATLILTLCSGPACIEQIPFDPMPSQMCAIQGQAMAADWMRDNGYLARGYQMARYRCQIGARRREA